MMDYATIVVEGHAAWFELLARIGSPSRRFTGGLAVTTGVLSNTDNGVMIDPSSVEVDQLAEALGWLRTSSFPASCVLTAAASDAVLDRLLDLWLRADAGGNEMGRSLLGYRPVSATVPGYEVVEATTGPELMGGLEALGEEWYDDADRRVRHRLDLAIGVGPGSPARHWVARHGQATIALATSFRFADVVVLQRCGVDPAHRRRGVATALTAARLMAAVAEGATTAVLSPSPDGYELHRRLDFALVPAQPNRWFHVD